MPKPLKRKTKPAQKRPPAPAKLSFRHMLVPLDFSGLSRQALTSVVPLARKHRAKISLVHVVQTPVVMRAFPDGGRPRPLNTVDLVGVAKKHLDELAAQLLPAAVRGRTVVRTGNAANEVVLGAKALKADLIKLSNTGRSGLKRVLLGSTAERIVRHAHCPVLTVRRQLDEFAERLLALKKPLYPKGLPWRRMLVPLDLSPASIRALKVAAPLAKQSGARLVLLNVVEPNLYPTSMEGTVMVLPDAGFVRAAKTELAEGMRRVVPKSVRATAVITLAARNVA